MTLIDLDPAMTRLFRDVPLLRRFNHDAFHSPKVKVLNADAFAWLDQHQDMFDFIVVDFPDPTNYAVGKLYTNTFYRLLEHHLNVRGRAVIQSTSPLYARQSFWMVANTLQSVDCRPPPIMRWCRHSANGVMCWPAASLTGRPPGCRPGCALSRRSRLAACSSFHPTWHASTPASTGSTTRRWYGYLTRNGGG